MLQSVCLIFHLINRKPVVSTLRCILFCTFAAVSKEKDSRRLEKRQAGYLFTIYFIDTIYLWKEMNRCCR